MKKIYSFIALMMLLFTGSAQAQSVWDLNVEAGSVATISTEKFYALHCGMNPGYGNNGYLNTGSTMTDPGTYTDEFVFQFVQVDEKTANDETFPVYILKNVGGQYLASAGGWTNKKAEAFRFTCRKSTAMTFAGGASEDWYDYSTQVIDQETLDEGQRENQNCPGSVAAGTWVLCSPTGANFLAYVGNAGLNVYHDTVDWLIYEATAAEMTAYQRLTYYFGIYCTKEVNETNYPVGSNPGMLNSQEVYDRLLAAYNAATTALGITTETDEYYNAVTEELIAAYAAANEATVQVGAGYYTFINQRSQDALRDNGSVTYAQAWTTPEAWTLENVNVVWEVVPAAEEGKFFVRNFLTGNYLGVGPGTSSQFPLATDTVAAYSFPQAEGNKFLISQNGQLMHCDGSYKAVTWNDKNAQGNWHLINVVNADELAGLKATVDSLQNAKKWSELALEASAMLAEKAYTEDGLYLNNGLVTNLDTSYEGTGYNSKDPSEGSVAGMFDGNTGSYFHSSWRADGQPGDYHFVQVDLGKEVSELVIKMTQRQWASAVQPFGGDPRRIALRAPDPDTDPTDPTWVDLTPEGGDTVVYTYATKYPSYAEPLDSTTAILHYTFDQPVQKLRFVVLKTKSNQAFGGNIGPCWHLSELRFYEDVVDPAKAVVPAEVVARLQAAYDAVNDELEKGKFNEATYTELEEAIEAYWESYPDASYLESLIEDARTQAETAAEAESDEPEMGYFYTGASAELNAALDAVEAEMDAKKAEQNGVLSAVQIEGFEADVKAAVAEFNTQLVKPTAGVVYRVKSNSENENIAGNYMYARSSDLTEKGYWGYTGVGESADANYETRLNLLWLVEECGDGLALKNLGTGRYLCNIYTKDAELLEKDTEEWGSSPVNFSATPDAFTFVYSKIPGSFNIQLVDGWFLNTQPTGNMVTWWDMADYNNHFTFEEVESFEEGTITLPVYPNALQGITLPYDVNSVFSQEGNVYKVLGQLDGKLQMEQYEDGEVITAGTPFVVLTGEEEDYISAMPDNITSLDDVLNLEYHYTSKTQNGLVGALNAIEQLPLGVAYFAGKGFELVEEGDGVAAGSAYLNGNIPVAESEGTFSVEIPAGIQDGIQNVTVVRNAENAVYTISGIKVRNNSQAKGALQNLPKGVYIIGGKKVIVK